MLSNDQVEQYSRQIILPGIGGRGQERLLAASVALFGCTPAVEAAAVYLAAAGVGRLVLVRQSAGGDAAALAAVNADCRVTCMSPDASRIREVVEGSELLLSGPLEQTTRNLLNAACVRTRRPLVWAEVDGSLGRVTTLCVADHNAPCVACFAPPAGAARSYEPAHDAFADLAAAFVGTQQASEAIRLVVGSGPALAGRLLAYAALDGTITDVAVSRDPACAVCGAMLAD